MKIRKSLSVISAALLVVSCDNGSQLQVEQEVQAATDNDEFNYFGMQVGSSETIPFEPELGFAVPDRGPLALATSVIGSTTAGNEYRVDCDPGQVLAGVDAYASGSRVTQITAKCVEVKNDGAWISTPIAQGDSVGINSGTVVSLQCVSGEAVTGITGFTRSDWVASLKLHCRTLSNSTTTTGDERDTISVGENNPNVANQLCGAGGVATGIHGRATNDLMSVGLVCNESPATAGRWGNPIGWPVQAVHTIMTPQGNLMSYGFKNGSPNVYDYDLWSPAAGVAETSHNTFASDQGVFSFCNASIIMPDNGNILLPGGQKLGNNNNEGVADVPIYNTETGGLYRAPDMANRRWYPTTVTLPNGEILVAGGRDVAGVGSTTPEIYSPQTNEWRSLFGANMSGLHLLYPRLWVAADGRVFGVSRNQMYYINTQGSGAIQRVGEFNGAWSTQGESTSVMYRPGKILQLGGFSNGNNAALIDINGTVPQVRLTNPMRFSRSSWASSVVLADGKVMASGGSRKNNDADTAAMSPEIWDPETELWTVVSGYKWPRLYHSNSVLLQDATVMILGGGNPGPVTNYNAEIFSPPYLYDAEGSLAERPVINWAPEKGAYGQAITLQTDASAVAKVSFIKTTSVTHSFNVEQRYRELAFTTGTDSIQVQLPISATDATPGFYLMFVLNEQGVPSLGKIIKLGDELGEVPAPPVITPEPVEVDNLLVNGGFEQGKANWFDCADTSLSAINSNASTGEKALIQQGGACLYQEFFVQPGETVSLTCDAATQNSVYSSVSLNMLDANYTTLLADSSVVSGASYTTYSATLDVPANATFAAVTMYSEGPTSFDSCVVTSDAGATPAPTPEPTPEPTPVPPATNILVNSDFAQGKSNWLDCSGSQLTTVLDTQATSGKILQVANAGCIYQEFPVTPGKKYRMQCSAKSEGTRYSSITLQMADATYNQLDSAVSLVGPGEFQSYTAELTAPAASNTSAVTLYSEDITQVDVCNVEEI